MAFNRICTSVYRIYVICMAFGRMPCGKHHMLGFHPQSPERGRPRRRFEHGITFYLNLYVNLPCPREMGNAHFSNVKPVPERSTEIYSLSSEIKTHTNTIQFKSFLGVQGPFFKKVPASFTPILLIRRCTPPCMSARRISPSRENVSKILCISRRYSEYPVSVSFGEYDEDSTRAVQPRRS